MYSRSRTRKTKKKRTLRCRSPVASRNIKHLSFISPRLGWRTVKIPIDTTVDDYHALRIIMHPVSVCVCVCICFLYARSRCDSIGIAYVHANVLTMASDFNPRPAMRVRVERERESIVNGLMCTRCIYARDALELSQRKPEVRPVSTGHFNRKGLIPVLCSV